MIYRNIKTGAIVDVTSTLSGAWEPVQAKEPDAPVEEPAKKAPKKATKKGK